MDQAATVHRIAANQWTALREEARFLHETYAKELPHPQLIAEVRKIDDRYNTLCQALEPTDLKSFEAARKRIKSGRFSPDFKES